MKVTVEVSDEEMEEIRRYSKEKRKGAAIRKLALDALMLRKREALGQKVLSGEWAVDLPDLDSLRRDRRL